MHRLRSRLCKQLLELNNLMGLHLQDILGRQNINDKPLVRECQELGTGRTTLQRRSHWLLQVIEKAYVSYGAGATHISVESFQTPYFKSVYVQADAMAQLVKAWCPEFDPQDAHDRRGELTLTNYPWTSVRMPQKRAHASCPLKWKYNFKKLCILFHIN